MRSSHGLRIFYSEEKLPLHLSKPQKLIYDMDKLAGGSISNICGSILFDIAFSAEELVSAINIIFETNDALRISVSENDGVPSQTINEFNERDFEVLSFDTKADFKSYAEEYAREPMDMFGSLCDVIIIFVEDNCGVLIKLHHLIGDAWTLALIGTQLNAVLNGETPEAFSYSEYLENEDKYINSKRYGKDKEFFLEQFKKCDEATLLSEKNSDSFKAERKTYIVDKEKTETINAYCQKNELSVFSLLMSALGVYLNRIYMNAERFYVGTAVLNRTSYKYKNTAGMFINTVPALLELKNEESFIDNANAVQSTLLSVLRHQKYNYNDVLADIRKEYDFGEKLYDVVLSYQNAQIIGETDFESEWYHCGMQMETLQIHIDDRDNEGTLTIHYDYLLDKITEKEIDKLHEHLMNLLFDGINNDNKNVCRLNILSESEKQKLLIDFNDTEHNYPKDKCVHQLFEEQVLKTPDKTAVIACDKDLTYAQLNCEANRIAHSLIKDGIGVGDIVAFILPRKSYLISTMFGVLKSGAAYLPIDPDYPKDRIEYMLNDSNANLCITEENIAELLGNDNTENPCVEMSSDSICYCIYTSGSTGKPKGALLKHKGIVNLVTNLGIYSDLSQCICFGFMTTITFDVATQEIFTALLNGYTGALAPERSKTNISEIIGFVERNHIDIVYSTPTYFDSLTSSVTLAKRLFNTIKVVCLAGEKFYLNKYALEFKNHITFENQYGPVELHVIASTTKYKNEDIESIGIPIPNCQAYIVDSFMHPVPIGVKGELCFSGECVGAGYLNRPELTAEKFIDNPFGEGKLYKTGDLAYWREDGNIVYVGRNDFQVKIRGLRIELGEIENAISSIDGISQCVVVVRKNAEGRQFICAFYTGKEIDSKDIRAAIGTKLPKYMLPHIITRLKEMPLTPSGKISRNTLPTVDLENISNDTEYVAPTNEKEKSLCEAAAELLNIEQVGIKDSFIDLGGDSLKAIELVSMIESKGYKTNVKDILNVTDFSELAKLLVIENSKADTLEHQGAIPATPAQMRVYTAQSMDENSTLYNVSYAFKVEEINREKLQTAVNQLLANHEILKTRFENKEGQIIQVIDNEAQCQVEALPNDDFKEFIRPFDLSKAPLLRVGICGNTVMVDIHHIITDGSSMPVFFKELNDLYMGREAEKTIAEYREFAVENIDHSADEQYWLNAFKDELPLLEMNTDFPRKEKQSFEGNVIYDTIDISLHNQIKEKSKGMNITPFVFYMAGFNILLSKFSQNEDIVVGIPVSGRTSKYLNTIGMFVNTLAIRTQPEGDKAVDKYLNEVKDISLCAMDHQFYPLGELIKKLNIQPSNRNPLFDVMLAYQDESMTDIIFGDKKAELLPVPITTAKCDFTFNIMPRENDIVLMAEYCTALFKEKTIKRLINGYKYILQQLLTENELKDITAITPKEYQQLMFDFNNTKQEYPKDKCVHQLFEEQVLKAPNKTAVIACDKTLTYAELNEEANRIAHSLIEEGIGKGNIVAFILPRKSCLISTMLGILKCGAAYLPIDPDYPKDRIEYMLDYSNAKLCVTEENIAELLENGNTENPCFEMSSDSICYCIYTSGSTGEPKGVSIRHKNLANFVSINDYNTHTLILKDSSILLSTFKSCFDAFNVDFALILTNGKTVVLADDDCLLNAEKLAEIINIQNIDIIHSTPSIINTLSDNKNYSIALKNVKYILLGAENFSKKLYSKLSDISDATLINGYGPSETTVGVTFDELTFDKITIGHPIANTQIYIVDNYTNPTPIGVTGELCIAGDGVGAGYLNRPELTAEKFIDNPFGEGKLYKTGDLAYWREDGNIAYVGRNDFQVKIRGLRIELGEIENAISGIDGINQCVVVVRKNSEGRQLICAFYTGKEIESKEIRTQIGKKLPKYMLPNIFTHLDSLPLTSSGKTNRNALPEIDLENIEITNEYVAPENEQQKELCRIMSKVLNVEKIGINDDFFELGGDSLKAIEFVSKAHSEGIYFSLQNIYDNPTVKQLCEFINSDNVEAVTYDENDFSGINEVLSNNTIEKIKPPQKNPLGNILLAGATGYLGMHILADYLDNDEGTAYCIIRGKDQADSENRLADLLSFYFGNRYDKSTRIKVYCGDLLNEHFNLTIEDYNDLLGKIDTVINCAASVKHYGSYQYFYDMNVANTKRLIDFAKAANAKLIHTSTLSVSGNGFGDDFNGYISDEEKHFYESTLYIGQPLNNVYAHSKFEAEKLVLEGMQNGLQANIMRMGNLTNRSDGQFQINYESNAFAKRVKGVIDMGVIPDYLIDNDNVYCEFTPIDEAANAVMTIARHFSNKQTVFHINSINVVYFRELVEYIYRLGIKLDIVGGKVFTDILKQTAKDSGTEYIFETFINDMNEDDKLVYDSNIRIENEFTVAYLKRLGFEWSKIGFDYIKNYLDYFRKIEYFGV